MRLQFEAEAGFARPDMIEHGGAEMMVAQMIKSWLAVVVIALVAAFPVWAQETMKPMKPMGGMMGGMMTDAPVVPPVAGFSEGHEVLFLHTETSDPELAKILTEMMGSPVLVVPSLANAPKEMLARVYVFTNGVTGEGPMGPLGFQPDVFERPPGTPGYTPLRTVILVTWKDEDDARALTSAAEVEKARKDGDIMFEEPGVVVNMPMVTWPGGQR